jgi:hypothetical protein
MDFTWITPSAGSSGAVVQVVGATTSTTVSTTSASYVDSGLTVTITPTSASNKVMLFVSSAFDLNGLLIHTQLLFDFIDLQLV